MSTQRLSTQHLTILIFGLALLLIGGCILLLGAQSPNPVSNTIGAIFTLFGTTTNYLQLFFPPPYARSRSESPGRPEAPSRLETPGRPESPGRLETPSRSEAPGRPSSVLMYFRLSGILLIIGDIIFAVIGLIPYSLYSQTLASSISLLSGILLLLFSLGLPALQMKQSYQTRWLGLSGVAVLCTSYLLFAILDFITINSYLINYYPLFYVANALQVIGSVLLGIAIIRASTFPRWAGMLLIVSGIIFIGTFMVASLPDIPLYIITNAANLTACIAFIRCGYTLLQQNKRNAKAISSSSS
jgi:hypothetical protein